jgi:hypothetical protein
VVVVCEKGGTFLHTTVLATVNWSCDHVHPKAESCCCLVRLARQQLREKHVRACGIVSAHIRERKQEQKGIIELILRSILSPEIKMSQQTCENKASTSTSPLLYVLILPFTRGVHAWHGVTCWSSHPSILSCVWPGSSCSTHMHGYWLRCVWLSLSGEGCGAVIPCFFLFG